MGNADFGCQRRRALIATEVAATTAELRRALLAAAQQEAAEAAQRLADIEAEFFAVEVAWEEEQARAEARHWEAVRAAVAEGEARAAAQVAAEAARRRARTRLAWRRAVRKIGQILRLRRRWSDLGRWLQQGWIQDLVDGLQRRGGRLDRIRPAALRR